MPEFVIAPFDKPMTEALVRFWRVSFEHGVGIIDPHPIGRQTAFSVEHVLPDHAVHIALAADVPVGFIAFSAESISQL